MNAAQALRRHWQAQQLAWPGEAAFQQGLEKVLAFSPFVAHELRVQAAAFAALKPALIQADFPFDYPALWQHWQPEQPMAVRLRRFRRFHTALLAWRDLNGLDAVAKTLAHLSALAECCIEQALRHCEQEMRQRFGQPLDGQGRPQRLTVLGMGKLGGGELNFSSDIDLIFCFAEQGQSDGPRPLDNEQWFIRLGQQLIQLLDAVTEEGFVYRVDMRLRPYGKAGRLALSHAAMETYYETQGRMWERYALIKARAVAGDRAGGQALLQRLQPFIYRRYLDYTAFDELAAMKQGIHAQYQNTRLADNIKLGPGGIREVEFIVQSFQLIWGGRIASLRKPPLEPALQALAEHQLLEQPAVNGLQAAYRYLRRLENHLQAREDAQTQTLPETAEALEALALSMGHEDAAQMLDCLRRHRQQVSERFQQILPPREAAADHWQALASRLWAALDEGAPVEALLEAAGFTPAASLAETLARWWQSPAFRQISARGQQRLQALLPDLLQAAAQSSRPQEALQALLELVQAVARRSAYLALLQSHRQALRWLVEQLLASRWVRAQLLEYPLLLDEMLEWQTHASLDPPARWRADLQRMLVALPLEEEEQAMVLLRQFTLSRKLQIALLELQGRLTAVEAAAQLTQLAEVVLLETLGLAQRQIVRRFGHLAGEGPLRLLAYGSLAAENLSYDSDLDLVFLYQGHNEQAMSDGPRVLPTAVYQVRLAQRFVHLLTTRTTAGQLYELDLRLRPNGNAGLLVTTFQAFARYQREKSWTWEQQALVKTRLLGEAPELAADFETLRAEVLARPREPDSLREEICDMRLRMWQEKKPRSAGFHLKNSPGGLVDLDFLLQYAVLAHGRTHPELLRPRSLGGLLRACAHGGLLEPEAYQALLAALECFLAQAHQAHLNGAGLLLEQVPEQALAVQAHWQHWLNCDYRETDH